MASAAPILPTTCAASLVGHVPGKGRAPLAMGDVPAFASEFLGFRGLNAPVQALRGLSDAQLQQLAHRADQAGCPFLALVDDTLLPFDGPSIDASTTRLDRLLRAARMIGAAHVGVRIPCEGGEPEMARVARSVREALGEVSRHEITVLLRPCAPGMQDLERFTALIQRIGGFRIGAMASTAMLEGDGWLAGVRRIAPYSGCIQLVPPIKRSKPDGAYIKAFVHALVGVGFQNSVCVTVEGSKDVAKVLDMASTMFREALEADAPDDVVEAVPGGVSIDEVSG